MANGSTTRRSAAAIERPGLQLDRNLVAIVFVALAIGYCAPALMTPARPDRPVLRWVAAAAKNLLWIAAFAERPPAEQAVVQKTHDEFAVDHGRGW